MASVITPEGGPDIASMRYAGFWPRLGALIVDTIVFAPMIGLSVWGVTQPRTWAILIQAVVTLAMAFYSIYFVGRWGQTLGKMALRIKVVAVDGSSAGFRRAIYRYCVDLGFSILSTILIVHALLSIPDLLYDGLSFERRMKVIGEKMPSWSSTVDALSYIWVVSELVVLLFNAKRRALHDFIAGTVVIHSVPQVRVGA